MEPIDAVFRNAEVLPQVSTTHRLQMFASICLTITACLNAPSSVAAPIVGYTSAVSDLSTFLRLPTSSTLDRQGNSSLIGSPVTANRTVSNAFGEKSVSVSADLASGTLKASAENHVNATSQVTGVTGSLSSSISQGVATYGDSFTHTSPSGAPFEWVSSSTARFAISIDGFSDQFDLGSNVSLNGKLQLVILEKGTLDSNLLVTERQEIPLGGGTVGRVLQEYVWSLGPDTVSYTSFNESIEDITPIPISFGNRFSSFPRSFEVAFQPGDDFDWFLQLTTEATIFRTGVNEQFGIVDFDSTITVEYIAPDDAVATSYSGFPGTTRVTTPVPEPTMGMLLALGITLLCMLRGLTSSSKRTYLV